MVELLYENKCENVNITDLDELVSICKRIII